jgi:hypothetical protein
MADVFAEVDEAMRRERLEKLWREHGKLFVAAIAVIVLATGVISAWRGWNDSVNTRQTELLITAFDSPEPVTALQQTAEDLRPGLRGIALLTAAGMLMNDKKTDEALALYERAAAEGLPAELEDMAVLARIAILIEKETPAEEKAAQEKEFQKSLKKIWSSESSPWRFHARLQSASLLAGSGEYRQAANLLEPVLEEKQMPASLNAKIKALHHVYALQADAADKAEEKAQQEEKNSEG